ncbi:MAG TPA: NRDE family protein [Stellaceae bacterium]|nr:NRDE family protein [Stellaceae bacterium]
MCTVVLLRRPQHEWPLILGANRDEMASRPWKPPARHWPDRPEAVAGLDVLAGGSWFGLNDAGVVAAMLNRHGTLGPAAGFRSRGELVLEALDHHDAAEAARALRHLEPRAYRPFNMIVADNRDAFWLKHADPTGTLGLTVTPIPEGVSMLTAGELDDTESSRIRHYHPLFVAAKPPDPGRGDYQAWEKLLSRTSRAPEEGPSGAMRFLTEAGFGTVSSALVTLPKPSYGARKWHFRFASWLPKAEPWHEVRG